MASHKSMAARGTLLAVILLAAAAVASAANGGEPAGRDLLQTSADCARSVPYCNACKLSFSGGRTIGVRGAAVHGGPHGGGRVG